GLVTLPDGNLAISTRRGEVYIVENPTSPNPYFRKFASGLHEILGLAYKDGALYCAQRGELTKLVDTDNDGKADVYETVYAWPLSSHYHRSEEHTSELQSRENLVCRLLLEKKNT